MEYQDFSANDFMMDGFFVKWVKDPDPETELFWKNWLVQYPEKADEVKVARQMLEDLNFAVDSTSSRKDYQEVWSRLQRSDQTEKVRSLKHSLPRRHKKIWYQIAAAVAGILIVFGAVKHSSLLFSRSNLETAYSEVKTLELPDGSLVTLSPNSKISYNYNRDTQGERELWLNGEAFFSVKHLENHQKFIVHANDIEVEVLGTEFNVNDRGGEVKVVLENGLVNLRIPKQEETIEILMKPGELVHYWPVTRKTVQKALSDTRKYTAWKDRILVFKGTPVSEIAQVIKDYHGLNVIIKDPGISERAFTAEVPVEDPGFLLTLLAESLELKITGDDKTIIIENK